MDDTEVEQYLRHSVGQVDNLGDREDQKVERMQTRFARVAHFLDYLDQQEEREHQGKDLVARSGVIGKRIVPALKEGFQSERTWIERRVRENRERYSEDEPLAYLGDVALTDKWDPVGDDNGGSGSLTGPCSVGKEAARGLQNRGQGYRGVAG